VRGLTAAIFGIGATLIGFGPAIAQNVDVLSAPKTHYTDGVVGQFDDFATQTDSISEPATITAKIATATTDRPAVLLISAKIAAGKHTYSLTQPAGGPKATKIELEHSTDYRLLAPFRSNPVPKSHVEQGPVWTGLMIQEHEGEVTWYAPIEITAGVDLKTFAIRGTIHMQVCDQACVPVDQPFVAHLEQIADLGFRIANWPIESAIGNPQATMGSFQSKGSAVKLSGQVVPSAVRAGESADLQITATMPANSHIYAHADRDPGVGTKPVLIAIQTTSGLVPHRPTTDAPTKVDNSIEQFGPLKYHEGTVTWTLRLDVPKNAPPGEYPILGLMGYQACESRPDGKGQCELPHAVRFAGTLKVGDTTNKSAAPLTFAPDGSYSQVAQAASVFADFHDRQAPNRSTGTAADPIDDKTPKISASDTYDLDKINVEREDGSFAYYVVLAFAGGIILNLMPCVLPVLGLKVMSFVEQAGRSRAHALALNAWFAAGIVTVFLLLGVLAISIGLTWGGQFGNTPFNVTMAAVVFAMALALLGVWEIPIPGFFGSGSVHAAASQEGPAGAFLKGVITTVLATPCTAPFMASAVAWAVAQPPITTLIVFASLGLGMASPYLVVGFYPELLRFLPKPGAWMETFKQAMGFVLLATVVFILSFIEPAAVVPTVALLMGIGVACWLASRTPLTADFSDRVESWALAGAVVLAFGVVSFGWLYRDVMRPRFAADTQAARPSAKGPWQPFSLSKLKQVAVDQGRTVLVDFSAEWCFNCKALELAVLHTEPVQQAITQAGVETMYADYTNYPPEIDRTIKALRANGVPVIAIFPGDAPYKPIVFRGGYTTGGLIAALEKATGRRLNAQTESVAEVAPAATAPRN
jgi:suppressor for copper-sensitivity B